MNRIFKIFVHCNAVYKFKENKRTDRSLGSQTPNGQTNIGLQITV